MTLRRNYIKALSFPAATYALLVTLILWSPLAQGKYFPEAVTIDFVITVPIIYFFASRKFKTRWLLVFPLVGLGFASAEFLLPETLTIKVLASLLLPILEVISLVSVSYYVIRFYREAKRNQSTDGYSLIKKSVEAVFGRSRISKVVATEFAVVYYAFFAWRRDNGFTSYKQNNTLVIYGFLLFVILVETLAFHFLFLKVGVWFAWTILATSLYLALQLFAHAKALRCRVIEINAALEIRYGLIADVTIPLDDIKYVSVCSNYHKTRAGDAMQIGLLKMLETYSVAIELHRPVGVESIYGITREATVILIPIDEPSNFVTTLEAARMR